MESLGLKFKSARDARGFTVDQVARDTHIAKRFIAAIEEENFEPFPGDTYILGFIRNYSEYIGLDPVEMVNLYKNLKIQEQPIPMQELLHKKRSKTGIIIFIVLLLLGGLAAGGYYVYTKYPNLLPSFISSISTSPAPVQAQQPRRYSFTGEAALEQSFGQGDELTDAAEGLLVKVDKIEDTVRLVSSLEELELGEGEEAYINLDEAGAALRVTCRGIDRDAQPPTTVLVFESYDRAAAENIEPAPAVSAPVPSPVPPPAPVSEPSRVKRSQVIRQAAAPEPFTIEVDFRGYCLFRYTVDGGRSREERYFRSGENFRTDVRREIRLWYSNAASLRARIAGTEIVFGKAGEVGSSVIRWVQAEAGGRGYRLEMSPLR